MQQHIYFCNIQMKHMQRTSETHETYGCNMCSSTYYCPMKVDMGVGSVARGADGTRCEA